MASDFREIYKDLDDAQLARVIGLVQNVLDGALNAAVDNGLLVTPPSWEENKTGARPLALRPAVLAKNVMAAP